MSQTVTVDVLNEHAMSLLMDLERQQLIRVHESEKLSLSATPHSFREKYKGAMSRQPLVLIESQLNELRNEWE